METAHLGLLDWSFEPTVSIGVAGVGLGYAAAWRQRLLSSSDDTSPWLGAPRLRVLIFGVGLVSGWLALQSPIDTGGDRYLLFLHMLQHLVLMMVAPPLVLLGIVGARPPDENVAPRLRALWTALSRPWPAALLFNSVLLVWHLPALYNATLTDEPLHIVEHLTFVAAGVLFWWPIVDPLRRSSTVVVSPFQKMAMLVLAGVPPTVIGLVFALSSTAYYSFYTAAPRLWGLSAVSDQQIAGVMMFGAGNLIYFLAISIIFLRLFGRPEDDESGAEEAARRRAIG